MYACETEITIDVNNLSIPRLKKICLVAWYIIGLVHGRLKMKQWDCINLHQINVIVVTFQQRMSKDNNKPHT